MARLTDAEVTIITDLLKVDGHTKLIDKIRRDEHVLTTTEEEISAALEARQTARREEIAEFLAHTHDRDQLLIKVVSSQRELTVAWPVTEAVRKALLDS